MNTRTTLTAVSFALALLTFPLPLRGEPITLTGGSVQVSVTIREARIVLEGDEFSLTVGAEAFNAAIRLWPFTLDTPVDLGASWHQTAVPAGPAVFKGIEYPRVVIDANGTFVTPLATLTGSGEKTVALPFTFTGSLTAFARQPDPGDEPIFTSALIGSGTARARFSIFTEPVPNYSPVPLQGKDFQLEYEFAPIPEPGTLLLIGTGALAMATGRRRRRSG